MTEAALLRPMITAAWVLASFALLGAALVALTFHLTQDRIAANEQAAWLSHLNALVPPQRYDNALLQDTLQITAPDALGTASPVTVYRAYRQGQPVAVLASVIAPDGYSGAIRLLVGVYADGALAGVRVLAHRETPGLGDAIEISRSDWIRIFDGKSLDNPPLGQWAVRKDGGAFDQFTGATVTPRAVVRAVRQFLLYFRQQREALFKAAPHATGDKTP